MAFNIKPTPEELANAQRAQHGDNWQPESFSHVIVECDRLRIARSTSSCYESEVTQHSLAGSSLQRDVECCGREMPSRLWKNGFSTHVVFFLCSFLFHHRMFLSCLHGRWKVREKPLTCL